MMDLSYTTIHHNYRIEAGLSLMEYCFLDSIYHLSNNPRYNRCTMSKEKIAIFLGVSKQTVHELINKMISKGFIEKDEETKFLKTTQKRYDNIIERKKYAQSKNNTPSKESLLDSKESLLDSKESLHNNNSNNNSNNNKKEIYKEKYLDCVYLSSNEYKKLVDLLGKEEIESYISKLNNYMVSNGKQNKYKSHYHTILTWYGKDKEKDKRKFDNPFDEFCYYADKGQKSELREKYKQKNKLKEFVDLDQRYILYCAGF